MTFRRSSLSVQFATAAAVTGAGAYLVARTEQYDPAGTPWALPVVLILLAAHLPLALRSSSFKETTPPPPISREFGLTVGLGILLTSLAAFLWKGFTFVFERGLVPRADGTLGQAVQVMARFGTDTPIYYQDYAREGFGALNQVSVGAVVPYAIVRNLGYDWRFASLLAGALAAAMLAAGLGALYRAKGPTQGTSLLAAAVAFGGVLASHRSLELVLWSSSPALWAVALAMGLALSSGNALMGALLGGYLAAMNPGWVLLLPAVGAVCWKLAPRPGRPAILVALLAPPALAYMTFHAEFYSMAKGLIATQFLAGKDQYLAGASRFPTLHGFGDFLALRPALYVLGVVLAVGIAVEIARRNDSRERLALLALAAFIVVALGPATMFFHWFVHAALLAGLMAGVECRTAEPAEVPSFRLRPSDFAVTAGILLLCWYGFGYRLLLPIEGTMSADSEGTWRQPLRKNLFAGWNVHSADHVWTREKSATTGFALAKPYAGVLELDLFTLGGDFVPINPTIVRVNGRPKAVFRAAPGEYRYARIPLTEQDVLTGFNVIELESAWVRTPRSFNIGNDDRTVGIGYRGLRYIPTDRVNPRAMVLQR